MRKAVNHLKKSDPILAAIIAKVGPCRLAYREPVFGTLVRSIVYQQLNGKVASAILELLLNALPDREPTPAAILALTPEQMRAAGLSAGKSAYLRDLAEKTLAGEVEFESLGGLDDAAVIAHLTRVKGIGVWTAHMFLIFALRRGDVLPVGDLGVRSAVKKAYGLEAMPTPKEMEKIAEKWRPHCSVAAWYLWRSLDGPAEM
jgi:DNA-3-methyladenine glycosylase II